MVVSGRSRNDWHGGQQTRRACQILSPSASVMHHMATTHDHPTVTMVLGLIDRTDLAHFNWSTEGLALALCMCKYCLIALI